MVAGVLQQLGIDMGPSQPPDHANPSGYFEDLRFQALHRFWSRKYETDLGRNQLRLPPWEPVLDQDDLGRYTKLIQVCARRDSWGVKDPELCYYAKHFATTLRRPIKLIATTRDKAAAAASIGSRRRWFSPADCDMVIDEYVRRQALTLTELAAHGITPALVVDYDEAIADPAATVQRIAAHVGLPVTDAATSFIAPELRKYRQHRPADTPRNEDQGLTTLTM
jgi:hypothetical protein